VLSFTNEYTTLVTTLWSRSHTKLNVHDQEDFQRDAFNAIHWLVVKNVRWFLLVQPGTHIANDKDVVCRILSFTTLNQDQFVRWGNWKCISFKGDMLSKTGKDDDTMSVFVYLHILLLSSLACIINILVFIIYFRSLYILENIFWIQNVIEKIQ